MGTTTPPAATAEQYRGLLERLLPKGPAWALRTGAELNSILLAVGDELARAHGRLLDLLDEADPRTADEMIEDWERVLNLPDPALGTPGTLAARRLLVHARWIARGGQTEAYFLSIALALGLVVTISAPCRPFRAGLGRAGDPCYSLGWAYGWRVSAPNGPIVHFRAGSRAGYRVQDARQAALEALFWRYAPAHTIPVFEYHP